MGLETFGPDSRPDILNTDWPLLDDPLNKGDDHLRLLKTTLKNLFQDVWDKTNSHVKVTSIPPAVNDGNAGTGFGGFRYQVVDNGDSTKTLKLFTT